MKRKLRGIKRSDIQLDFDLYRESVPIPRLSGDELSVIDIWPEGVERTILFVHGYAGCADTWEHQINHFSKEYRVVAPDLRGHGQSDAPYTRYSMPELVADLYAITQHLHLPPKFILIGHSFGGSICIEYANIHPEQLERLVLIATAGEYPLPKATSLAYRLPTAVFRPWWDYRPRWNAEVHVLKRMAVNNLSQWQGWSLMRNIRVPTLIITGERDNYFPRYVFDDVAKMIPGAQVVDVGVSKHKVQLERHQAVNRTIERFIEEDERRTSWRDEAAPGTLSLLAQRPWLSSYSPGTPRTVPIPRRPLHEFLESTAEWLPKQTATVFFGSRLTYAQLNQQANQFAHVLHGLGISPGDRVMILLPNMPELVIAYYATLKIGGVVVFSNLDASAEQVANQARQTQAEIMVTLADFEALARHVRQNSNVRDVITVNLPSSAAAGAYRRIMERMGLSGAKTSASHSDEDILSVGRLMIDLIRDAPVYPPQAGVSSDDLAAILYTTGTTDNPKGVRLSHGNLVANTVQTRHWIPDLQYGSEVFLSVVPLSHSYGMTTAMNLPIAVGATMLLLPSFELEQVLQNVWAHKPTIFPGVPAMYAALNHAPNVRTYNLSSIRACISGASPLPVEIQETFEKLTRGRLVEGYGLTEASPVTHANPIAGTRKAGSIGVPLPNTDARVVDLSTGEDVVPGVIGELAIKGPQVMLGYLEEGDSESTLREGWLFTGDVAVMDLDGYFRVIGRKRDIIEVGQYRVFPRDVEEVLYENSKVREASVVAVPDAANGQRIKAFIVPRSGTSLSEEEILEFCRRRLDQAAVPSEIEFRTDLPRSFVGKVVHRLLEDG